MKRTTLSLIAAGAALAAVTSVAAVAAPEEGPAATGKAAQQPVERTSLLCPAPSSSELAETTYTAFTPKTEVSADSGTAALVPAARSLAGKDDKDDKNDKEEKDDKDGEDGKKGEEEKPFLAVKKQGAPVTAEENGSGAPALIGLAEGSLAPGWSAQQTTHFTAGAGRGLHGAVCSAPDTDFWFPGASTAEDRSDYLHLTNPDDAAAVVDIELYGKDGALDSEVGEGIQVPPRSSVPVLLSTLTGKPQTNLTVHVTARSGRVAAAVQALDQKVGGDWLTPSAEPSASVVLPGIPKDATAVRLVAFAPGSADADLKVSLAGPNGSLSPAGNETLHLKSGMTTAVDLADVTRGEPGSLVLTPTGDSGDTPVVAAVRVIRGKGAEQESAFIPAARPVGDRATVTGNGAKGTYLSLTAPGKAAKVRVTASAGTGGGTAATKTYSVGAGRTLAADIPLPDSLKGTYALTVETVSGGPVHASRTLTLSGAAADGISMFTVQNLTDDRGTVTVPAARPEMGVLLD
ncbi:MULTISPECIES: DUF5719 family protein [Streptomyces]|uniref:DUF5719 family protein n=1 Tax=Streptomyces TaxID=1883 RepID=UPI00200040D0|nr:DUF5719 family protein [Streptomyces sp. WAC00276]MCK2141357.1 DUF5719 family protein [Streptomyces sp. WAC00276]WTC02138.1 DUF5719 family protein [Streptomyces albidoflavus]